MVSAPERKQFFFKKKEPKNFFYSGPGGLAQPTPPAQSNKVFLLRAGRPGFCSQKEVLP
jgi:hypothetical protein